MPDRPVPLYFPGSGAILHTFIFFLLRAGMKVNRRDMLKATAAAAAAPMINLGSFQVFAQATEKYSERAVDLVRNTTTLDMLNPFSLYAVLAPLMTRREAAPAPTWFTDPTTFGANDFAAFRESGIDV